jgi:hypothetical protein
MRSSRSTHPFRRALVASLLVVATTGCYKATFMANPNLVRGADHDQWNSFFLWGLVGQETLDVRQFCSGGQVAQARTGANFLTGLVSFVTLGIYAPRMAYVWCAAGPAGTTAPPPAAAAKVPMLAIYGDRQGRPVRVELRRGDALEAVATPTPVDHEQPHWRVAFVSEVAR